MNYLILILKYLIKNFSNFQNFINLLPKAPEKELLALLKALFNDPEEYVRFYNIDSL